MTDFSAFTRTEFGVVGICVGAAATLYLRDSASPGARKRIAEWLEHRRARFGDRLRWCRNPRTGRWQRADKGRPVTDWLPGLAPAMPWEVVFHGGNDARDASDTLLAGYGSQEWSGGRGYVRWAEPGAAVEADATSFCDGVIAAATALRPTHGYAGWTVIESPEVEFEQAFQPAVWALAQRHVGLDVGAPLTHLDHLQGAVKGAAWLVVLEDTWLARCPDVPALDGQDGIKVHPYPGGVVIQAGAGPVLGEALGDAPPGPLQAVARALAPIRVKAHPGLHFAGPDRMHEQETRRWLARFERDS